jgi:hypothetical protein
VLPFPHVEISQCKDHSHGIFNNVVVLTSAQRPQGVQTWQSPGKKQMPLRQLLIIRHVSGCTDKRTTTPQCWQIDHRIARCPHSSRRSSCARQNLSGPLANKRAAAQPCDILHSECTNLYLDSQCLFHKPQLPTATPHSRIRV